MNYAGAYTIKKQRNIELYQNILSYRIVWHLVDFVIPLSCHLYLSYYTPKIHTADENLLIL